MNDLQDKLAINHTTTKGLSVSLFFLSFWLCLSVYLSMLACSHLSIYLSIVEVVAAAECPILPLKILTARLLICVICLKWQRFV